MNDRVNKTSICSIVFLDIIDYSKKSDSEQISVKVKFNDLISRSLKSVAQNDRIILDTGDGVAIALMGSPEDAMFVALTIRDGILKSNVKDSIPLYVRFGINLGPVRTVIDINNQPNIIGDGINVAQRIMSFAQPNQILVSRSYYEVTSRLTEEFSEMFDYSGIKHDKHVREHEVYSIRSHKDQVESVSERIALQESFQLPKPMAIVNKINWKYAAPGLFACVALLGFAKWMPMQAEAVTPAVVFKSEAKVNLPDSNKTAKVALIPSVETNKGNLLNVNAQPEIKETPSSKAVNQLLTQEDKKEEALMQDKAKEDKLAQEKSAKAKLAAKKAKQKAAKEKAESLMAAEHINNSNTHTEAKPTEHKKPIEAVVAVNAPTKEKSGLEVFAESFKQGKKSECTQVQISMNQCH